MDNSQNNNEYYTIDLLHILKTLWQRAWLIAIAAVLAGMIGFILSAFLITPQYSSSIMLYVNNSSLNVGEFNISTGDLNASKSLIKTYTEILDNRTTLSMVIDKLDLNCTYIQLSNMIKAESSNDTEIMKVTVTTDDAFKSAEIANCIAEVLPRRINDIIEGATMEVVDSAVPHLRKVSPSITKYTAVGVLLGAFLACGVIAVFAIMDDTIHDEDYVIKTYNYPILAKIPDLTEHNTKRYGYYYRSSSDNSTGARN